MGNFSDRNPLTVSSPAGSMTPEGRLTASLKNLFSGMNQTTEAVPPFVLLNSLRAVAPQFAEQDARGGFSQQGSSAIGINNLRQMPMRLGRKSYRYYALLFPEAVMRSLLSTTICLSS